MICILLDVFTHSIVSRPGHLAIGPVQCCRVLIHCYVLMKLIEIALQVFGSVSLCSVALCHEETGYVHHGPHPQGLPLPTTGGRHTVLLPDRAAGTQ